MFLKGGGRKSKKKLFCLQILKKSLSLSNFYFKNFHIFEPKRNLVLQRNCLPSIDLKVGWVQVIIHLNLIHNKGGGGTGYFIDTPSWGPCYCSGFFTSNPGVVIKHKKLFSSPLN